MDRIIPDDVIRLVLDKLATEITFSELVQKSFTCRQWSRVVQQMARRWQLTSLKIFTSKSNFASYRRQINNLELLRLDDRFMLNIAPDNWLQQDHLIMREYPDTSMEVIIESIKSMFSHITFLVINTSDIDQVQLLKCFPALKTLVIVELPVNRFQQREIFEQVVSMTSIRHLHILCLGNFICSLDVAQFCPLLSRLESFTLSDYPHLNRIDLIRCLDPDRIQRINLGLFANYRAFIECRWQLPELIRPFLANFNAPSFSFDEWDWKELASEEIETTLRSLQDKLDNPDFLFAWNGYNSIFKQAIFSQIEGELLTDIQKADEVVYFDDLRPNIRAMLQEMATGGVLTDLYDNWLVNSGTHR